MGSKGFYVSDSTGRWILVSTVLASSMAFISGSVLNVALSALQADLGATDSQLLWIISIYMLTVAALILIGGSLGDHYGRKRIFGIGIALFALSSAASGIAPDVELLILARGVQGIGGALMIPGSLAIISALFADSERGRAIGIWSAASTITTMGGPILGGVLVDALSWRFVFYINVPLALIALFALTKFPETKDEKAAKSLDFLGAITIMLSLGLLTYGSLSLGEISRVVDANFTPIILSLIAGVVLFIMFIVIESRVKHPMLNLDLFRSRVFSGANLMTIFLYAGLSVAFLFLPLNLTAVQGYSASLAGFAMIPTSLGIALLSPWAGTLLDRYGPRLPLTIGPLIVVIGFALFALQGMTSGPGDYWLTFFPAGVVTGIGMGIVVAPLTASVMGSVPKHESGIASGINNSVTRFSQALATALVGALAIVVFAQALETRTADIIMPEETREELLLNADQFANTQPPESLDAVATVQVNEAIDRAFIDTYQAVAWAAVILSFISMTIAFFTLRNTSDWKAMTDDDDD